MLYVNDGSIRKLFLLLLIDSGLNQLLILQNFLNGIHYFLFIILSLIGRIKKSFRPFLPDSIKIVI